MRLTSVFAATLCMTGAIALTVPAQAQATRTWVSGVGDDVNPCSRTAPCKTFAGAISKTAAGGEIDCLDPGGFGTLTITKSIVVDCAGTFGSALNSGGINGFVINDSATATPGTVLVTLRNLSINGAGTTKGLNGIRFISGAVLHVENVTINNQSNSGINFAPNGAAELYVTNTIVANAGVGGVIIAPPVGGRARVRLSAVSINDNTTGLSAKSGGTIEVAIKDSVVAGNTGNAVVADSSSQPVAIMIDGTQITQNLGSGLRAMGSNGIIRISNSQVTGNVNSAEATGGANIHSYGNNQIDGNLNSVLAPALIPER